MKIILFLSFAFILGIFSRLVSIDIVSISNSVRYRQNKSWSIVIKNDMFEPKTLEISKGDVVEFINRDIKPHWPASNLHPTHDLYPEFDPKRQLLPGSKWVFRFTQSGIWYFHDHINPILTGKITVSDNKQLSQLAGFVPKKEGKVFMDRIENENDETKRRVLMRELTFKVGPRMAIDLLTESNLPIVGDTHLIAHVIGEVAYAMFKEQALEYCDGDRLNGCAHGLILSAISDIGFDGVAKMVRNCKNLTEFKFHMCLHAAGHAFLAFEDYKVDKALVHCDQLVGNPANDQEILHCYNGLFMENAIGDHGGLAPFNHPSLSTDDLLKPCNIVEEKYVSSCYLNQTGWWIRVFGGDVKKTAQFCSTSVPKKYQEECANDLGRIISTLVKNDIGEIQKQCSYMASPLGDTCLSAIALSVYAMGDEKLPFRLCTMTAPGEYKENCYLEIANLMKRNGLSLDKTRELCTNFEPNYRHFCE